MLIVNKRDAPKSKNDMYDFYELGLGEPIPISAVNRLNFGDVLDEVVEAFPDNESDDDDDITKIAVIGKPNVGKSSLINEILGENRVIVSPIAGTTRDSIDTPFTMDGKEYIPVSYTHLDVYKRHGSGLVSEAVKIQSYGNNRT